MTRKQKRLAVIGGLGAVVGAVIYVALFTGVAGVIRAQTGVVLDVWQWDRMLLVFPLAMIALSALGGIVPAVKAYRTPVAETLAPVS